MPKKKSRTRRGRGDGEPEVDQLDNASVISLASEGSETSPSSTAAVDDEAFLQTVLEKVCAAVELLNEKRVETRVKALRCLVDSFRLHYLCLDGSWNYAATLLNGLENILKRGKNQDQILATECLSVVSLQFDGLELPDWIAKFLPLLSPVIRDASAPCILRATSATALCILQFLVGYSDCVSVKGTMKSLESIFRGSCLKGDGKAPVLEAAVSQLHLSALRGWTLLFTILPTFEVNSAGTSLIPTLLSLLQAFHVDMRISAGETMAVIYERIRCELDENFKGPHYGDLINLLNELATDGTKNKSKGDRKKQRHSFRDLLESIARYDYPETTVKFGTQDMLLSSCIEHFYYELLCDVLGSGVGRHLQENCTIRDLFDLGLPLLSDHKGSDRRALRDQRRSANSSAFKLRTQKLSSYRDRRSNVVNESD